MARLSEKEKAEFLRDSVSLERKQDFARLRHFSSSTDMTPSEFIDFLDWVQRYSNESCKQRKPISGSAFLI